MRIACLPGFTYSLMPRIVANFSKINPSVVVSVAVRSPETVWSLVASRQCDVGLARPLSGFTSVDDELLMDVAAVCVVPRRHRLASKRSISADDLSGEPMIAAPSSAPHQSQLEWIFAAAKVEVRIVAEIQYSMQRCALVAQGLGISIVDPIVARDFGTSRFTIKAFTPRVPIRTTLLFPSQRPPSRLTAQFCDLLRAEIGGYKFGSST